jgi:general secretion pathway protein M
MLNELPKAVQRLAAVALLIATLTAIALLTVVPIREHIATVEEQIEAERTLLGRFAAVASQESQAAEFDRAGRAAIESGAYLRGDTETIKASALQTLLSETAAARGVRLYSTRALPPRERDGLRFLGVGVQFQARIDQLRALMHAVEAARPFLFVEGLQIHPLDAYSPRDPEHGGLLDVRFDVFGAVPQTKE